jgi:hypothetical protein
MHGRDQDVVPRRVMSAYWGLRSGLRAAVSGRLPPHIGSIARDVMELNNMARDKIPSGTGNGGDANEMNRRTLRCTFPASAPC